MAQVASNEAIAIARYVRMAPRKVRMVADLVRGMSVDKALETLQFSTRAAALPVAKCVQSAAANAGVKGINTRNLVIKTICVDEGPTLKRIRPRAKGSASRINKRTSHITVSVAPGKEA